MEEHPVLEESRYRGVAIALMRFGGLHQRHKPGYPSLETVPLCEEGLELIHQVLGSEQLLRWLRVEGGDIEHMFVPYLGPVTDSTLSSQIAKSISISQNPR
jgi:hypothetical protein